MKNKKLSIKTISSEESRKTNGGIPAVFIGCFMVGSNLSVVKTATAAIGAGVLAMGRIVYTWD